MFIKCNDAEETILDINSITFIQKNGEYLSLCLKYSSRCYTLIYTDNNNRDKDYLRLSKILVESNESQDNIKTTKCLVCGKEIADTEKDSICYDCKYKFNKYGYK